MRGKLIYQHYKKHRNKLVLFVYFALRILIVSVTAICAEQRPLVRLPAATWRSPTATLVKVFR